MHPSPSLFYSCHFRSPGHPDGKPLSHSQLLPSLCFLHVISHCVLSALILNPHICSFFPFSLSSLFQTLSLLLGVGNLIGLFVSYSLISLNHPTQLWSEQLPSQMPSGLIAYENYWPLPVLSPTVPSPSHMFYQITLLLTHLLLSTPFFPLELLPPLISVSNFLTHPTFKTLLTCNFLQNLPN